MTEKEELIACLPGGKPDQIKNLMIITESLVHLFKKKTNKRKSFGLPYQRGFKIWF